MSPHLIEKQIHCPERCKQISCHHILLRKKIHCPERCKKKNQKNLTLQFQQNLFGQIKNKNNLLHKFQAWEEKKKSIPPPKS